MCILITIAKVGTHNHPPVANYLKPTYPHLKGWNVVTCMIHNWLSKHISQRLFRRRTITLECLLPWNLFILVIITNKEISRNNINGKQRTHFIIKSQPVQNCTQFTHRRFWNSLKWAHFRRPGRLFIILPVRFDIRFILRCKIKKNDNLQMNIK